MESVSWSNIELSLSCEPPTLCPAAGFHLVGRSLQLQEMTPTEELQGLVWCLLKCFTTKFAEVWLIAMQWMALSPDLYLCYDNDLP